MDTSIQVSALKQMAQDSSLPKTDSINSTDLNANKVFKKIDSFLNLGSAHSISTDKLSPSERDAFLKSLAKLLKQGIVGTETLDVNGRPEKHFVDVEIGNTRLYGRRTWEDTHPELHDSYA